MRDASKLPQSPSRSISNGSSMRSPSQATGAGKTANGNAHFTSESNGSASHTNGGSLGNGIQDTEPFFGHNREEVTRILIQSLSDLGYHGAASSLIKESGCELEGPTVASFRSAVLAGEWAEAEALLFGSGNQQVNESGSQDVSTYSKSRGKATKAPWSPKTYVRGLTLAEDANENEMKFWLRQQKYLELLEGRDLGAALAVLQQELMPLHRDVSRLHTLSSLMMCQSAEDLKFQAQWDGGSGQSRQHLLSELSKSISPSVMIPEHRLAVLLDQVKENWIRNCLYHNTAESPSLYVDHICDHDDFPRKLYHVLTHHTDEVWYLKYSNDGTKLATASKDSKIVIYDTTTYRVLHTLSEHEGGVCYVAWSPDDSKLISCAQNKAQDNSARLWDVNSGISLMEMTMFTYPVTTAAWAPNGETFVTGSQDTEHALIMWNLQGSKAHQWREDNMRVHDVAISPNGEKLVVLLETRIFVYDYITREKLRDWAFDDVKLTSVDISQDSNFILISMNDNKIRMMDIATGETIQCFDGHVQAKFIIRSSFGGAKETFVVSGSEDSRIYIWRTSGHLVETLDGHVGCVNAVSWHPKNPLIFASAGDDHKVRIWTAASKVFSNGADR